MDSLEGYLGDWFSVSRVELPDGVKDVQELPQDQITGLFRG